MKRLAVVVSVFLLAACGATPHESELAVRDKLEARTPLLVFLGGNSSCKRDASGTVGPRGLNNWGQFQAVVADLTTRGEAPAWIATCHKSDEAVHLVASDAPDAAQTTTDFAGLYDKIDALAEGHPVVLSGHSYGGWLALKAMSVITAEVSGLVTIDPISREHCSVWTPSGCTEAPRDITTEQRQRVAARSDTWINFYQTETSFLHSAPMAEADENPQRPVGHTSIDVDAVVWARIGAIASAL